MQNKIFEFFNKDKHLVGLTIFIFSLILFLLGNWGHSLWDRDEARFSEASYEMIKSGDWVVPRFNNENRFHKPIMIYWLQSSSMRIFGINEFASRFPSSIAGAFTILLIYLFALKLKCSPTAAVVSAIIATLNILLYLISKAATTDSVLILSVVLGLFIYWIQYNEKFSWWRHILFWFILGISTLTKGPPGLFIIFSTIIIFNLFSANRRNLKNKKNLFNFLLRLIVGIAVFLIVCLPWGILVWQKTGGEFFREAIGRHVIERSVKSFEGHKGPIVYYVPVLILGIFPFIPLLINSIRYFCIKKLTQEKLFLLCWIIPSFIIFSIVKTKLPHYIAPLFPAIVLMIGQWWAQNEHKNKDFEKIEIQTLWWKIGSSVIILLGLAALIVLPIMIIRQGLQQFLLQTIVISAAIFFTTLYGGYYWFKKNANSAFIIWSVGIIIVYVLTMLWFLPSIESLRPSKTITNWIRENSPANTKIIAVKYQEPSLVFYWKDYVEMLGSSRDEVAISKLMNLNTPTALIITNNGWTKWLEKNKNMPADKINIKLKKKFFIFEQGKWINLVVIGNW